MTAIYGLYDDPDVAQRAVDGLRAAGVADADIQVMSSEPFEDHEFSHKDSATWLHWIALAGGVLGLGGAYWLTSATQQAWPIVTSGMPIVAPWPNLIVIFEMTMLGAILATVVTLFITAKLPTPTAAALRPRGHQRLHPGRHPAAVRGSHAAPHRRARRRRDGAGQDDRLERISFQCSGKSCPTAAMAIRAAESKTALAASTGKCGRRWRWRAESCRQTAR